MSGAPASIALGSERRRRSPHRARTPVDRFGLDLALRARVEPAFRFLQERYWRVEVAGAQHVPAGGACVLVANHSGALPFDGAMIITAVQLHAKRVVRFLYDRFVAGLPPVDRLYRRLGGVEATRANAEAVLAQGEPLLVFPEGVSGVAKPFTDRYRLRSFSSGFVRLAMQADVPVVPVAVVGAEEIYPMLGRIDGVEHALGVPYLPITPFFPALGLLGALPLPTKWFIRFGNPIQFRPADDGHRVRAEVSRVRRRLQAMLTRLVQRRRSVFFG